MKRCSGMKMASRPFAPILAAFAGLLLWLGLAVAQPSGEDTMLLRAASSGSLVELRQAIEAGADLEARDAGGRTALLLATHANHVAAALALIDAGADVNARDYAGAEGRDAILTAVLATGRANLRDTNRYGGTALIPAAHHGHPATVRILLSTGIDIDHVNDLGWTALVEAVILGDGGPVYQEIVGLLVDAGARDIPDRDGVTPLGHARRLGFAEIAARIAAGPAR